MKKYGCSNIDDLVDELKRLRIGNKELQDELMDEKCNYARADQDRIIAEKKVKELQSEIDRLNKTIEYMDD